MLRETGRTGFEIADGLEADTYLVRLRGEFDMSVGARVEAALRRAEESDAPNILIDLDGLTFIDSTGLQSLVGIARRSDAGGKRIRFTRGLGAVADTLRLTAVDRLLPFIDAPPARGAGEPPAGLAGAA